MANNHPFLRKELERSLIAMAAEEWLVIHGRGSGRYLQFWVGPEEMINAEFSSDEFLDPRDQFGEDGAARLVRLGWNAPVERARTNFWREFEKRDFYDSISHRVVGALYVPGLHLSPPLVYQTNSRTKLPLTLERIDGLQREPALRGCFNNPAIRRCPRCGSADCRPSDHDSWSCQGCGRDFPTLAYKCRHPGCWNYVADEYCEKHKLERISPGPADAT